MEDNGERKKRGGGKVGRTWKTGKVKKLEADIVQAVLGNPSKITVRAIAESIGRPLSTVARAMKSPEVKARLKEILYDFVDKELVHAAVANITKSIISEKDVGDSKWLLEHVEFFPDVNVEDENKWAIFQKALADGILEIVENAKSSNGDDVKIDGLDPTTFVYFQPEPPVGKN